MPEQPSTTSRNPGLLLIVDGHCYAYRAFFAITALRSPSGQPTNAIYGFIRMLGKMQAKLRPSHLIVIWDGGLAGERLALLPEYKAQRPEMPDDLQRQLDPIMDYLRASRIATWMQEGSEADDCIAALALRAAQDGLEVVIASSDKDFMQLVSDRIRLFNPGDKSETLWDAAQVETRTGVKPAQIVDWLSLFGDSVDNISGVPGVGPKTATTLLAQFGSIDALYERLEEVKSDRLRTRLMESADLVRRNRQLVRLKNDVPFEYPMEKLRAGAGDLPELGRLFSNWGFKNLLNELPRSSPPINDFFHEDARAN